MQEPRGLKPNWLVAINLFLIKNGNISSKWVFLEFFRKLAEAKRADDFYKFAYLLF